MMNETQLRERLLSKMREEKLSYQQVAAYCSVSASTLCRFVNGSSLLLKNMEAVEAWLSGDAIEAKGLWYTKRFKIKGSTFLMEIKEI